MATNKRKTASSTQTVTDMRPLPGAGIKATQRITSRLISSEGDELACWLNAAKEHGRASYERIENLLRELEQLPIEYRSAAKERTFIFHYGGEHQRLNADGSVAEVFPADSPKSSITTEKIRRGTELSRRHDSIHRLLSRYTFGIEAVFMLSGFTWVSGLISHHRRGEFVIRTKPYGPGVSLERTYGEGDAALAALRLLQSRELDRLRLCPSCHVKWNFVAKRSYRFCDDRCRQAFYESSPDYLPKKADTQKRYRSNKKRYVAAGMVAREK